MHKINAYLYIFAVFSLTALIVYSYVETPNHYPPISKLKENPNFYNNAEVEICGKVIKVLDGGIIVSSGSSSIEIRYEKARLAKYGTICAIGIFHEEGFVLAEFIRYNDFLFLKYGLSFLSLLYVFFVFFKEWKFTKKGFFPRKVG